MCDGDTGDKAFFFPFKNPGERISFFGLYWSLRLSSYLSFWTLTKAFEIQAKSLEKASKKILSEWSQASLKWLEI